MPSFGINIKSARTILFLYMAMLVLQQIITLFGILYIFENNITLLGKESIAALPFGIFISIVVFCLHCRWDRISQNEYDSYVPHVRGSHPLFWLTLFAACLQVYITLFSANLFGEIVSMFIPAFAAVAFIILMALVIGLLISYQTNYSLKSFASRIK